jgi:nickel/cobalt transporter (NicO) family protein
MQLRRTCLGQLTGLAILLAIVCGWATPAIAHSESDLPFLDITQQTLTPSLMVAGVGLALLFGAGHALAPGHGKTMVAAYLVGSQGTARHAVILGLITTVTHMLGVYVLALLTFVASAYVLPETLHPILEAISGLTICAVGLNILYRSIMHTKDSPDQHHCHVHHHHDAEHEHEHTSSQSKAINLKSLLSLGIAGGLVPCPSALVLLLSAVSLHQAVYGMVLISAFSVGLAGIMVALGLVAVYARQWLEKIPSLSKMQRYLPIASSIAMIAAGVALSANVVF